MIEELKQRIEKIDLALLIAKMELNSCYYPVIDVKAFIQKQVARMEKNAQLRTERENLNKQLQQLLTANNGST